MTPELAAFPAPGSVLVTSAATARENLERSGAAVVLALSDWL
jgi:hypothetical protein